MTQEPGPTASPSGPSHEITFPPELPISERRFDIARTIDAHQVVIVAGETGSGKSTQLPKICLAMGRGVHRRIGCTQPRRLAATSVAARVAREIGVNLGEEVGYKIRFHEQTRPSTYVKFMTDGILLAETQGDPMLWEYDTLILDEAHERSLNIDFLLGYLKRLLPRRPDLKLIVCSATLDVQRFSTFFNDAPVLHVSGRTYPVDVLYRPPRGDENDLVETIANTVEEITELDRQGDILIFLPGEREIREVADELATHGLPHTTVLPLYARLSAAEQARVFQPIPQRRIVLATNVAETSLTIPGIVYVIDPGLARINRYIPRTGVTSLQVEAISQASAEQRKGRCGRVQRGVCFRLYEEEDFRARPEHTDPEIKRAGLAGVILRMKSLHLGDMEAFPFLDPPAKRAVDEGYRVLEEIGALDERRELTPIGHRLAQLPVDPRVGRMILGGVDEGALREVLVIASALSIQDPRERPATAQRQADEAHRKFQDETSDFLGLLRLWDAYQTACAGTKAQLRKFCTKHFLSYLRMKEWSDIHDQLAQLASEMNLEHNRKPADSDQIHRALLPGLLSRIGFWNPEHRAYTGTRQTRFVLHPSSGLAKKPPPWVVAAELVETTQLFARNAARVDPSWLEGIASHLCRRSYSDPHWEQKPAQVMAKENVTLFGLPIVRDRKVHFGPIDPTASRKIFLRHALVMGEYKSNAPFLEHNLKIIEQAQAMRARARRSDLMIDEQALEQFFEQRVADGVYSGKTFEEWRARAEAGNPRVLMLTLEDVLLDESGDLTRERYPDELRLYGARLPLVYKFDPREDDDGLTVTIPVVLLPQIDPGVFDWIIPGWLVEKVSLLLDTLPRALRKQIGSSQIAAREITPVLRPFEGPMLLALGEAILARYGVRIPPDAWRKEEVPAYLSLLCRVVDENGKELARSRDMVALRERFAFAARQAWESVPKSAWSKSGMRTWDIDELPETVRVRSGASTVLAYPALLDRDDSVELQLLEAPDKAEAATRAGLRRLFLLQLRTSQRQLSQLASGVLDGGALAGVVRGARLQVGQRAVDEVFGLVDAATFPRDKVTFHRRLEEGRRALPEALASLDRMAVEIAGEYQKTSTALKALLAAKAGKSKVSLDDIQGQLDRLIPPDLLATSPRDRLRHLPRYLKAIQVRLQRLPLDPSKDEAKAAPVIRLWQDFLRHEPVLRAQGHKAGQLDEVRWLIEEWRVQVFAPELKAAVPVSEKRLSELWLELKR
ncbi:MAG: ATP-dependent RNA helicase HrpA [Myxococcales bacterium]|nr:ATP-dependent RNA helicase HrpA [Polyangiaceae bacterium]MDW8249306.1 ATP-dependent RNA helicase HrpA [Myxococcales bacterium]